MSRTSLFLFASVLSALFSLPSHLTAQTASVGLEFTPLDTPCRAVDTRAQSDPLNAGQVATFDPAGGACAGEIPQQTGEVAYALNVTVIPHGSLGYLSVWPAGATQPLVSTLNSPDGRVKANAAIVAGGAGGDLSFYATDTTDLVVDVTGYFSTQGTYTYVPLATPCRLIDTRAGSGYAGQGLPLAAGQVRNVQVGVGTEAATGADCLPAEPEANTGAAPYAALSLNVTAVPAAGRSVGYVTVSGGPYGGSVPLASTLNDSTGTVVANAAIVGLGGTDELNLYASDATDLVVDVAGYWTAPSVTSGVPGAASGGLLFYPVEPCRVEDTRTAVGGGEGGQPGGVLAGIAGISVAGSGTVSCASGLPFTATLHAYVMNATVVPAGQGGLGFLALWPESESAEPQVSTLNADDGSVTSNMAIVTSTSLGVYAYTSSPAALVLDVSGYFAPAPPPLTNTPPVVVFVGDSIAYSALTQSGALVSNPTWINAATNSPETSASMLARFPQVLARAQQAAGVPGATVVVVIEAGMGDIVAAIPSPGTGASPGPGAWNAINCGQYTPAGPPAAPQNTCVNIDAMAQLAQTAVVRAVVADIASLIPNEGGGVGFNDPYEIDFYDEAFDKTYQLQGLYGSTKWDMQTSLNTANWTADDGLTVTPQGAAAWVAGVTQVIATAEAAPATKSGTGLRDHWPGVYEQVMQELANKAR